MTAHGVPRVTAERRVKAKPLVPTHKREDPRKGKNKNSSDTIDLINWSAK